MAQPAVSAEAPAAADSAFYYVPLPHTTRLTDAVTTAEYHGYPVLAYRFENPQIVGEFAVSGTQSVDDFLSDFHDQYGTEPMVVSALISVPADELEQIAQEDAATDKVSARLADFVAPPADAEKVETLFADRQAHAASENTEALRAPAEWTPTYAEVEVYRQSASDVRFVQYYAWNGTTTSTTALDDIFGMEFEVNIKTDQAGYQGSPRPVGCPADYKDRPFAKNYAWTWSVLMNIGNGLEQAPPAIGAYPDYNDLLDDCNKNSIAIGFRLPQELPSGPTGTQDILLTIDAPRGLDTTGKISGGVQTITNTWCADFPLLENTDCMGVAAGTAGYRPTLAESRGWVAPNKCWSSDNRGLADPVTYTCPA
ncbi:hypothetical protein [Microbacterium sp. 4-7]|uniref:hypothetical protein n=1 Tax=Microbacterium sp. 4-7 TaxID=1885327 RepID=UPI00164F28F9|nr:hypothetical protein [Microbacterium sp. 4-7]MBC6495409.1 hypothetical protein [Microbacterium sp. 4-7]